MGAHWLHNLPYWCEEAGIPYRTWDGWETRSRSTGGYDALYGICVHHTASNTNPDNDCAYMWNNAADKPIGAVLLDRTGRVTIGAAGATNCQGKGGPYQTSKGTCPLDQGNKYFFAIEAANSGTGEVWPDAQILSYLKLCKIVSDKLQFNTSTDIPAHFEWAPGRKYDPAGNSPYANGGDLWDMNAFRVDVGNIDGVQPPIPPPSGYNPPFNWGGYPTDCNKDQIRNGSTGPTVTYLQDFLFLFTGVPITVDGRFGTETEGYVKDFQRVFGLEEDGIVGWGGSGRNCNNPSSDATWVPVDKMIVDAGEPETPEPPPVNPLVPGSYWVREGDSPWSTAENVYGDGNQYPKFQPTDPESPGYSAWGHHIVVSDFEGTETMALPGEGALSMIRRMQPDINENQALDTFYAWNGGDPTKGGRVIQAGELVFLPVSSGAGGRS